MLCCTAAQRTHQSAQICRDRSVRLRRQRQPLQPLLHPTQQSPDEAKVAALDASLTVQFHRLGSALDAILDKAAGEGSEDDPLPIDYPKRRVAQYPTIYVGPRSDEPIA